MIHDERLNRLSEGSHTGIFEIEEIAPRYGVEEGRFFVEVVATLKTIALEMAKPSEFQLMETSAVANESDSEQAGKESLPLTVSSEESQLLDDTPLFGDLWPLGEKVVLDPTVDRATLRAQCEQLKELGYQCDPSTQVWQLVVS